MFGENICHTLEIINIIKKKLSLNIKQILIILNFLITGLTNSWASSLFTIAPNCSDVFLSKNVQTILTNLF